MTIPAVEEDIAHVSRSFRNVLLCYSAVIFTNYFTLVITTTLFSIISLSNFFICLSLSIGLCFFSGSTFDLKERQINLVISVIIYVLNLLAFINQGICNIWEVTCPYITYESFSRDDGSVHSLGNVNSSENFTAGGSYDHGEKKDDRELIAGLVMLASFGFSFVLNAWIVMNCTHMLHNYLASHDEDGSPPPSSPYRAKSKMLSKCDNVFNTEECLICQNKLTATDKVHGLPCKHIFHAECFNRWYEKGRCCPVCRRLVSNPSLGNENDDQSNQKIDKDSENDRGNDRNGHPRFPGFSSCV